MTEQHRGCRAEGSNKSRHPALHSVTVKRGPSADGRETGLKTGEYPRSRPNGLARWQKMVPARGPSDLIKDRGPGTTDHGPWTDQAPRSADQAHGRYRSQRDCAGEAVSVRVRVPIDWC